MPVNCAALPRDLTESLFLGHVRGAFTGAATDRVGYFEMAHEGTLFLDEIGEMPAELQSKHLRVLEDRSVQPVGESVERTVDVRVLAATNQDLLQRVGQGAFWQALYYRLARFTVTALLQGHAFPGNVRELKNVVERAVIESRATQVQAWHIHLTPAAREAECGEAQSTASVLPADLPMNLEVAVQQTEALLVRLSLERSGGNVAETARLLGTNRIRIYRILEQSRPASP